MFYGRTRELEKINNFISSKKAGFVYLRGRRRIGKSAVLLKLKESTENYFYFLGPRDASNATTLQDFAREWDRFTEKEFLSILKPEKLSWKFIFEQIATYTSEQKKPVVIALDEIQWIAKKGSGFIGRLKEAWQIWEKIPGFKLILAGSSNKFFQQESGGEEKILRGLKTHSDIWIPPFTPQEVKKYYLQDFSPEEACLTYMMLGGVPYYLDQLQQHDNFIRSINDALFLSQSIFLEEIDEILNLELNELGVKSAKQLLGLIGQQGKTITQLVNLSGSSDSTVRGFTEKLTNYNLLDKRNQKKFLSVKNQKNRHGEIYHMKDFYLNLFFQILEPLSQKIKTNTKQLLFATQCIQSESGYYIPKFSGRAFELLTQTILENYHDLSPGIFEKLNIREVGYEVYSNISNNRSEIDLVVKHAEDRELRLIEAKWVNERGIRGSLIDEVASKQITIPDGYRCSRYLLLSQKVNQSFYETARAKGVTVLGLNDLGF